MRKSTTGEAKTTKKVSSKSKLQEALTKMGVLEGTFAYECVMALSSVKATDYAEAVAKVSKKLNKPALTVHGTFGRLAKVADVSKFPKLKKLAAKGELTKEALVEFLLSL